MTEDTKTVTVTLSAEDHALLEALADADDRPITWQARRYVRQALTEDRRTREIEIAPVTLDAEPGEQEGN